MNLSPLQKARYQYSPKLPGMLRGGISEISVKVGAPTESVADQAKIKALFPNTYGKEEITFVKGSNTSAAKKQVVGVILSGGQAPGGHNVICGLYDAIKATDKNNVLLGFKGGPSGLIDDNYIEFTDEYINAYRNTGGFDIIGSGRTKLETEEQFKVVTEVAKKHGLTAIVIIGGDDSNTNAAVLAEYMAAHNTGVQVIGCPKLRFRYRYQDLFRADWQHRKRRQLRQEILALHQGYGPFRFPCCLGVRTGNPAQHLPDR